MKHAKFLIEKSRKLRALGKTYSEIQRHLKTKIPKSTLSYWCSKISLPHWYKEKIAHLNFKNFNKARQMAWVSNKQKQEERLKKIYKKNESLIRYLNNKDILKMFLSFLYLGEGSKWQAYRGLRLGNSDPHVILLYLRLLKHCYGIHHRKLKCQIIHRVDQNLTGLCKYWSRITSIPLKNFYKTSPDPRTKGKPTLKKNYKGVCVVSCAGADIQLELETIPKIILKGL